MSKEVLLRAFEKAEEDIGSSKKTHLSTYLSDILQEKYGLFINERTLRDYYTNFKKNQDDYFTELKPKLISRLCNYLGYYNYANFVVNHQKEMHANPLTKINLTSRVLEVISSYRYTLTNSISILSLGLSIYFGLIRESKNYVIYLEDPNSKYMVNEPQETRENFRNRENLKEITKIDSIFKVGGKTIIIWGKSSNKD